MKGARRKSKHGRGPRAGTYKSMSWASRLVLRSLQRLTDVSAFILVCSTNDSDLTPEDTPNCLECGLRLNGEVPRSQVELLVGSSEGAMREYNRRLGSQGVRQVLAHPTTEQLDKFVNLVQVADPSALANVLDDGVVEFLRQFLRNR